MMIHHNFVLVDRQRGNFTFVSNPRASGVMSGGADSEHGMSGTKLTCLATSSDNVTNIDL
jgi:hypothetical protein